MSLVVALHASADHYGLAADTRVVTHIVHIARTAPKTFTVGEIAEGPNERLPDRHRAGPSAEPVGSTRASAETALLSAWTAVMGTHGLRPTDQSPFIDVPSERWAVNHQKNAALIASLGGA